MGSGQGNSLSQCMAHSQCSGKHTYIFNFYECPSVLIQKSQNIIFYVTFIFQFSAM